MKIFWRWAVVLGFVMVLLVAWGFLNNNFGEDWVTGNVVSVYDPVSCDNSELGLAWDDIFAESSAGFVFFVNDSVVSGACAGFIGYKISGDRVWGLRYGRSVDAVGRVSGNYFAGYANMTALGVSVVGGIGSFSESNVALLVSTMKDVALFQDRDVILDIDGGALEFSSVLDVENGTWEPASGSFVFDESSSSQDFNYTGEGTVYSSEDAVYFSYEYVDSSESSGAVLSRDVGNFVFARNSSWNSAFNISDYFGYPAGSTFDFDYVGVNNTDGAWINYSIVGGDVRFKPAFGFLGTRYFRVSVVDPAAQSVVSNTFNVTIVSHINRAPNLRKNIGTIAMLKGMNLTVDLDIYFNDPDGDNLTYRTSTLENLVVTFKNGRMTVKLGANFSVYESFRVWASDGKLEKGSNKIDVLEGASVKDVIGPIINESLDDFVNGSLIGPGNDSVSGASQQDEGGDWLAWLILGAVLILGGFGFWFFFFKNKVLGSSAGPVVGGNPVVGGTAASPTVSPVNDYLKNLDLSKK